MAMGDPIDAGPLKVEDVTLSRFDLHARASDLGLDVVEVYGRSPARMVE